MEKSLKLLLIFALCSAFFCSDITINDMEETQITLTASNPSTQYVFTSLATSDNILTLKTPDGKTIFDRAKITFEWTTDGKTETYIPTNEGDTENIISNPSSADVDYTIKIECFKCLEGGQEDVSFTLMLFNEMRRVIPLSVEKPTFSLDKWYSNKIIKFSYDNTAPQALEFIIIPATVTIDINLYLNGDLQRIKTFTAIAQELKYKRIKEDPSITNVKYIIEVKGTSSSPPSGFTIGIEIKPHAAFPLNKIRENSPISLSGINGQAFFLDLSTVQNMQLNEEGAITLHFAADITKEEMSIFAKEISLAKADISGNIANEENEVYNYLPLTQEENEFPFNQLTLRSHNLYFAKRLPEDTENQANFLVFFLKTKDAMLNTDITLVLSKHTDMAILDKPNYLKCELIEQRPYIFRFKGTKGKQLLISSPNMPPLIYENGKMITDKDTVNTAKQIQVYTIEEAKEDNVLIVINYNAIDSKSFYLVIEVIPKEKNLHYYQGETHTSFGVNCLEGKEQTFVRYALGYGDYSTINFNKQYGSFEYYFLKSIVQENPEDGSILPQESDKSSSTNEVNSNFIALTVKCLEESGRVDVMFVTMSKIIDFLGEIPVVIPSGSSIISLKEQTNNANLEVRVSNTLNDQYPFSVSITYEGRTEELTTTSSVFRINNLSAPKDIQITGSSFAMILLVKVTKSSDVTEKPIELSTIKYTEPNIFFKFEQARVLSYKIVFGATNALTTFKYSLSKGIQDYIPIASIPVSSSPDTSEVSLTFTNPYNQFASTLNQNEFYYLAISVPISTSEYSLTFSTTEAEKFESFVSQTIKEIKPKFKYSLDFSNDKEKSKLVMYSELCSSSDTKAVFNIHYQSKDNFTDVNVKDNRFVFFENKYLPYDFEYTIGEETISMLNSYSYLTIAEFDKLPKTLDTFKFRYDNTSMLNWTKPYPDVSKYRIYIKTDHDSATYTNKCSMFGEASSAEVSETQFTFSSSKYNYGKYTVNILGISETPLPYVVLFTQQNVEFVAKAASGLDDPMVWVWAILGILVFVGIVISIILCRRKTKIAENNIKFDQLLAVELPKEIEESPLM